MADMKPMEEDMDEDIKAMKARVQQMEEEAKKLKEMQEQVEKEAAGSGVLTDEAKADIDSKSVYVGNVDYSSTPEELQAHFQACGSINRITILCDKFTGHPKGFAYVEFTEVSAIETALTLNESLFKGRLLKVTSKRTNVPGYNFRGGFRGAPRGGRGFRGASRGFDRGGYGGYRGRGAPFRGRGRGYYQPY